MSEPKRPVAPTPGHFEAVTTDLASLQPYFDHLAQLKRVPVVKAADDVSPYPLALVFIPQRDGISGVERAHEMFANLELFAAAPALKAQLDQALELLEVLSNYLGETHALDKSSVHYGDDSQGCAYCEAIEEAQSLVKRTPVYGARVRAAAPEMLSALRRSLNPTGHTDACFELREFGHTTCTKCCARIRAAITAATGEELPE